MSETSKHIKTFDRNFWVIITIFLVTVLIVCLMLPKIIIGPAKHGVVFDENTGAIGDTIGGILGPAIAVVVAGLTFLAFWVQYKANLQQKNQFDFQITQQKALKANQDKIWRIERFEDRFYELLRIHISNTSALTLADNMYNGNKVFQKLYTELKFLYERIFVHLHVHCKGWSDVQLGFNRNDREIILNISYIVYFWGVGPFSNKILLDSLRKIITLQYSKDLLTFLSSQKNGHRVEISKNKYCLLELNEVDEITQNASKVKFYYVPCDGHWQRLGTYYRHLFQTIKFVAEYDKNIIPEDVKYEYTKLIRAQLSNYEQLMLYYNALSNLGKDWNAIENNFIARFKLIKNIPVPLADFGFNPKDKYANDIVEAKKAGKLFFEWDE
ncbi:MAG: putative phage abortive infection protein [Bacteroidetes bacterium]|nr:putative phage abortive infection protein [Bacteroidota bacterium]